ncbi:ISLre2 family transposase [Geobacillus sp. FSL W8-0032]|uniref:ISLre2 family transposase n=1 Tax=Geobacillus TaxID=129337 RepID=UPI001E35EE32|nr:ISLre2 family transposase [Geobacillus subterraneus]
MEEPLLRTLQNVFATLLAALLEEIDQQLAEARDKRRDQLKDKRPTTLQTLFGDVTFRRNYYYDRQAGTYTFLLDAELGFDGAQSIRPCLEETAVELAVECSSYRKAARTLEAIVGYAVLSHEAIRQLVLAAPISLHHPVSQRHGRVLLVEADGLFISRQGKGKRAKEQKILAVHEGWRRNGSQLELVNRRHYLHEGAGDVWEGFEAWLMKEYAYDPCRDLLVINGDAASWITACREYFGKRACFQLDRFHVARELRQCLSGHPRWREVRKKLAKQDEEGLLVELNSAIGTLGDEAKEEQLAEMIRRIEAMPGCIRDYREWLSAQGVETAGMRPMGHAESVMSRFAYRVKSRRSWKDQGLWAFLKAMVAQIDGIGWRTGQLEEEEPQRAASAPTKLERIKQAKRKAGRLLVEVMRQNIPCLQRSSGTPIYQALSALRNGGWM